MTDSISALLAKLDAPGTFATRLRAPSGDLAVEVKDVGPLSFPITARVAQKLRSVARPSPFGLREQTLHDASVRNSWEVAHSRVKIDARRWKPALARYLRKIQNDLGLPEACEVEAVFDKLLIYEEGQFFKPHQDSEKNDSMIGTLVVILPSKYDGGAVTVQHRGEKKVFRRVDSQASELSLLAFYADCHHAISPIKSGVRVALTYQLEVAGGSRAALPKVRTDVAERLTAAVRQHFDLPAQHRNAANAVPPARLVYLLDHEYTERSLSWTHLKNGDRVRVAALHATAERLDQECFLALAEVHERWSCEDDTPFDRSRRYGSRFAQANNEEASQEHELIELYDSEIALTHWLDARGQAFEGGPGEVSDDELHFTKPSHDMNPFKSQHEGYQGNYGNTVDRWYHRAAFVMWPRENTFALRAQASPQWAVDELLAWPGANTAELQLKVSSVLPRWNAASSATKDARFVAKVLKVSARIDDGAMALAWLLPLGLHRLTSKAIRSSLAALIDKHGLVWGQELISEWTTRQRWGTPPWAALLADICADLHATDSKASRAQ